jgi:hypothetical protein
MLLVAVSRLLQGYEGRYLVVLTCFSGACLLFFIRVFDLLWCAGKETTKGMFFSFKSIGYITGVSLGALLVLVAFPPHGALISAF